MKLFVNARFLTQPVTGVQRYGIECSRQIKKLYPGAVFLAPKNILHKALADELEVTIIGRNKGHQWEQADLPMYLSGIGRPPLFSPANTAPLFYRNNYFTLHDLAFYHHPEWNSKAFSAWYNILVPRLARGSRHIFTVSQTMRNEIIKYYKEPPAKVSVTYNGLSPEMLASGKPVAKEKIILAVGTFNKRKNHQNLVSAFLASAAQQDHQLVIIGDRNKVFAGSGLDEKLVSNANIKIVERLTTEELINMYTRAAIMVSLSVYEGFGIPVLEGLYAGCRVLCSDIPVYRELYEGHVSFCDPYDISSISAAIDNIATGHSTQGNIDTLLEKYSYEASAREIIAQMTKGAI